MLHRAKPFIDLARITQALHSFDLTSDEHVLRYEERIRNEVGVPYCAAVDQGRAALLMALKILDVGKGNEVIVQSLICQAVIKAIVELGATPVLVDSSVDDFNLSCAHVMRKVSGKTKAIVAAHLYGNPCDIEEIADIARENDCYLIEDCAHTMRARYAGKNVGTFGDLAFFSTNFDKPYSTGEGGALVVSNERLVDRAKRVMRQYERCSLQEEKRIVYGLLIEHLLTQRATYAASLGMGYGIKLVRENSQLFQLVDRLVSENASEAKFTEDVYQYLNRTRDLRRGISMERLKTIAPRFIVRGVRFGMQQVHKNVVSDEKIEKKDLLMGPLRAIVGNIGLDSLAEVDRHRNEMASSFENRLEGMNSYKRPMISQKKKPTFLRYSVLNRTRHPLQQISMAARRKDVELGNYNWPKPVHLMAPYFFHNASQLKTSELIANNIINLPVHYYVDETDVDTIVAVLEEFDRR